MIPQDKLSKIFSLALTALSAFLFLCLISYQPADIPLLSSHPQRPTANLGGIIGAWLGFVLRGGFGWSALLLPVIGLRWSWRLWKDEDAELHAFVFTLAAVSFLVSVSMLLALSVDVEAEQVTRGGMVGFMLGSTAGYYFGHGVYVIAFLGTLLSWIIISGTTLEASLVGALESFRDAVLGAWERCTGAFAGLRFGLPRLRRAETQEEEEEAEEEEPEEEEEDYEEEGEEEEDYEEEAEEEEREPALPGVITEGQAQAAAGAARNGGPNIRIRDEGAKRTAARRKDTYKGFKLPPLELLQDPPDISKEQITEDLHKHAKKLEATLLDFGVEAEVVNIDRGPTVTRYELVPAPGVKLAKMASLADELAMVLKVASCHVVAPLPGKGTVGIDVPNLTTTTVYLKDLVTTKEFVNHPSPLVLPIGKDVSGKPVYVDLATCPHLLIAGATGSGKTVCLNSLLIGILSHVSPHQVRFMMVDPKMVELSLFNGIPHLVAPVVTNPKKAAAALQWAVMEMERRYRLLSMVAARNITAYNNKVDAPGFRPPPTSPEDEDGFKAEDFTHLPFLVVVIDELADLMLVASQDVETSIARLAQMSRAVGIHVILATQRPSVDVITGVIKANFPARVAFQVSSKVDSRTILDANGAEGLLGKGDLLFMPPGKPKPVRAQGAYLSDGEIEAVTEFLKQQRAPEYDEGLMERQQNPSSGSVEEGDDEMYDTAKNLVIDTGQASTSFLQRRLRIGYGRAARLLDQMEQEGIVGPPQGSKPREILMTRSAVQRGR